MAARRWPQTHSRGCDVMAPIHCYHIGKRNVAACTISRRTCELKIPHANDSPWGKRIQEHTMERKINAAHKWIEALKLPLPAPIKVWSSNQQCLCACKKWRILGFTPGPWPWNLHFHRITGWFICRLVFEKDWSRIIQTGNHFTIVTVLNSPSQEKALLSNAGSKWSA